MTFAMVTEDPFYDEDGVLVDEDADWQDIVDLIPAAAVAAVDDEYGPYITINS